MRATILPPPPPADFIGRSAYHAISGRWRSGGERWSEERVWSAVSAVDDGDPGSHVSTLRPEARESSDFGRLASCDTIVIAAG